MKNHIIEARQEFEAAKRKYQETLISEGEKIVGKDIFKKLLSVTTHQEKSFMPYLACEENLIPDELYVLEVLYENTLSNPEMLEEALKELP